MIEAHHNKSICREKARAGVATTKGFGAEDLPRRRGSSGNSDNIRFAVANMRSAIWLLSIFDFWESESCGGGTVLCFFIANV